MNITVHRILQITKKLWLNESSAVKPAVNRRQFIGTGRGLGIPMIATQAVPVVSAVLPIVRSYRHALGTLFDEPPTPHSLAGFIAARYTYEVIQGVEGPTSRTSVLQAFNRCQDHDLGGYRIACSEKQRSSVCVTQSMLGADGRLIG